MGRSVSCLKSDDKLEDDFVVEEGELVVGAYVGCVYEKQLWFAMIEELSDEFGDLLVSFLGPQGKSGSHAFPSKVDRFVRRKSSSVSPMARACLVVGVVTVMKTVMMAAMKVTVTPQHQLPAQQPPSP
ncbi:hypothetical protein GWK47_005849 [Chionoecetes opilio]|uniref:Uncharacterized protein n=1 Tax=Chionoecetes opilio TaxID=41210 RepID=A0A8J4Y8V0_CHIOP|nr:hypothetical protein GWK47_005849 [Chionoecetes opilio]